MVKQLVVIPRHACTTAVANRQQLVLAWLDQLIIGRQNTKPTGSVYESGMGAHFDLLLVVGLMLLIGCNVLLLHIQQCQVSACLHSLLELCCHCFDLVYELQACPAKAQAVCKRCMRL